MNENRSFSPINGFRFGIYVHLQEGKAMTTGFVADLPSTRSWKEWRSPWWSWSGELEDESRVGGDWNICCVFYSVGNNNPSCRTLIFFIGIETTNQTMIRGMPKIMYSKPGELEMLTIKESVLTGPPNTSGPEMKE